MAHPWSTQALTGLAPVETNYVSRTTEAGAVALPDGVRGLLHPDNPLLWFGGLLAVTFGLVGVSGSARVGKAKVSAKLDKA